MAQTRTAKTPTTQTTEITQMLDAHVRFERGRLTGPGLEESVVEEVAALYDWLRSVRLTDLAPAEELAAALGEVVAGALVTDETLELVGEIALGVHATLLEEEVGLEDLVRADDVERLSDVIAGMDDARSEIMDLVTTSEAYTRLVSHVLYHGVKSYVLTENVVARRVPGVSKLVRLGQGGLSSAAPGLQGQVDKQLMGFVRSNIGDILRESQRYLDELLDAELLSGMAIETWEAEADRTVGSVAALAEPEQVAEISVLVAGAWDHLRSTGVLRQAIEAAGLEVVAHAGDRPVADVLDGLGITQELVTTYVIAAVRPVFERASEDGLLETRLRARLEAFYSSYSAEATPKASPKQAVKKQAQKKQAPKKQATKKE